MNGMPFYFGGNANAPLYVKSIENHDTGYGELIISDTNGAELARLFLDSDSATMKMKVVIGIEVVHDEE